MEIVMFEMNSKILKLIFRIDIYTDILITKYYINHPGEDFLRHIHPLCVKTIGCEVHFE